MKSTIVPAEIHHENGVRSIAKVIMGHVEFPVLNLLLYEVG
jgi:hypothetical protein